jgi:hypothetical protein
LRHSFPPRRSSDLTWQGCTSLAEAAVPDTSNWPAASAGDWFLYETWQGCTSLAEAAVPDTSGWEAASVGDGFLYATWEGCAGLKDLSDIKLSDSLKDVPSLYSGGGNWYRTFHLESDPGDTTGAQPSFYDGTLITALGAPASDRDTFTNRSGMDGYGSLADDWK